MTMPLNNQKVTNQPSEFMLI